MTDKLTFDTNIPTYSIGPMNIDTELNIIFSKSNSSGQIGRLYSIAGKLFFEGDVDESAAIFMQHVIFKSEPILEYLKLRDC